MLRHDETAMRESVGTEAYQVYGGSLVSDLVFPELPRGPLGLGAWHLRVGRKKWQDPIALQGEYDHVNGWPVRLFRVPRGWCLDFADAGRFWILMRGAEISWEPRGAVPEEFVRAVVLGPVLAIVLQDAGFLPLHGSCVSFGGRAVAFLAPQNHGKSTLAAVLAGSGATLVADDLIALRPADLRVEPGVRIPYLNRDSATRLGLAMDGMGTEQRKWRAAVESMSLGRVGEPVLTGVYVLNPIRRTSTPAKPKCNALQPTRAMVALACSARPRDVLMGTDAGARLERIARVVRRVPVYLLTFTWDLEGVEEVAELVRLQDASETLARLPVMAG